MKNRLRIAFVAATVLVGATATAATAAEAAPTVVTVDVHAGLGAVPATGLGVNDAVWDTLLGSDVTTDPLRAIGTKTIRYPGGSYGDIYHWRDNTAPGGYVAPNTDFDTFMAAVKKTDAQPILIANYGTGTAREAADWVEYSNRTKHYGAKYWEIGNEIYGNGHYGTAWETDSHADKSPTAYANGVVEYAEAMKAVDPTIQVGAVLTTPGNWPDGIIGTGDTATWNQTVLSIAGPSIDFVVLHWYPGGTSTADALTKPAQAVDVAEITRAQITRYAGAGASRIGIALTEINAGAGMDTQPGALFAADVYPALWAAGVFTVNWWDVRNGIGTVSTVAGQTDYGDSGLFSSGNCLADGVTCEPALNTPFAPYHALHLLRSFARPGDQLIRVTTTDPLVHGHAVRRANCDLAVLLLNTDPDRERAVTIDYPNVRVVPGKTTVTGYLNGGAGLTTSRTGGPTEQILPPYSLTTFTVRTHQRQSHVAAPQAAAVTAVTDTTATVSWEAARSGHQAPASGYDVYLHDGTGSRLVGRTATATTLSLAGLTLGTRYTVTVAARDAAGVPSWSSPATSFVTGTPATSTCAVRVADTNNWGTGHVAEVAITNTGSEPVTGWELRFVFPRPWQSFGSGWNATWTAEGTSVAATNVDWNAAIAPGDTATIGYVGNYAGPNVLPNVFTLNGAVCTTR